MAGERGVGRTALGVLTVCLELGCTDPESEPTLDSEAAAETGADEEGGATGGPSESDDACLAAGGAFGVVATHRVELHAQGEDVNRWASPGLFVGPAGLRASVRNRDEVDPRGYGFELTADGDVVGPLEPIDATWAGARWWPGEAGVVATHCNDGVPGWTFVDTDGHAEAPSVHPQQPTLCLTTPSAAWASGGEALIAWLDFASECELGISCVRLTRAGTRGHEAIVDLFDGGSSSWNPSVSVAAGPESALVAMLRVDAPAQIVTQMIDLHGNPTAPTLAIEPAPSPESIDEIPRMDARAVPDGEGGFYVYLGGYGFSMGRVRLGPSGEVSEPLTALPPLLEPRVWDVFNSNLDAVHPRPGGWLAVGDAASGGSVRTLLSALDSRGEFVGHVLFDWSYDIAVASSGDRLFALGVNSGVELFELGCVVP